MIANFDMEYNMGLVLTLEFYTADSSRTMHRSREFPLDVDLRLIIIKVWVRLLKTPHSLVTLPASEKPSQLVLAKSMGVPLAPHHSLCIAYRDGC